MKDDEAMARAHAVFDPIAQQYLDREGVDIGRMFGSEGLRVRGKVFAFIGFGGDLMVKVPRERVASAAAQGWAAPVVMRGREMKEWLSLDADAAQRWPDLVAEAFAFVDEITP